MKKNHSLYGNRLSSSVFIKSDKQVILRAVEEVWVMRTHRNHWKAYINKSVFGIDFHRFVELEMTSNHIEIAEELGISLGEVNALKKKLSRTRQFNKISL